MNCSLHTDEQDIISANLALIGLANDFLYSATNYGKIIISEVYLDDHYKTIKPGLPSFPLPSSPLLLFSSYSSLLINNIHYGG